MLRRTRKDQREVVVVERVEPLPIGPLRDPTVGVARFDAQADHGATDVLTAPTTRRHSIEAGHDADGSPPTDADAQESADRQEPPDNHDTVHTSGNPMRSRSVRRVVVLITVLLAGVVGWMLVRERGPGDTLPWIPPNPTARYSWRVDGAITDDVSVYGTPDRAYVIADTDASITIDALDAQGNPRWSTDLDPGWTWGFISNAAGDVLVITNPESAEFDVESRSWATTLTLIDDDSGEIVWQTITPGHYAGNIGNRVIVSDAPSDADTPERGEDGEITDATDTDSGFDIRLIDTTTGEVSKPEHFDQVSYPAASESGWSQFTAPDPKRASFVATRDGEAFMLSPDLQPASTPVKVSTDAQIGFDGEHLLVIHDGVATSYDDGGREVAAGPISNIVGTEQVTTQGHGNGIWTYSTFPKEGTYSEDAAPDRPQLTCGAFRLDDAGVTGLWQRNDCSVWSSERLDDGTTVTFVYDDFFLSVGPNTTTIVNLDDGEERTTGVAASVGANGFVVERQATLLLTSLASVAPRAEIELAFNARWFLLDGGIAVIEPDNDGAAKAVSITMHR